MLRHAVGGGLLALWLVVGGAGCADPARVDRALSEVEAARREGAAQEAEVRALEERQAALAQQLAMVTTLATAALSQGPRKEDERDRKLDEISMRLAELDARIGKLGKRGPEPAEGADMAATRHAAEVSPAEERAAALRKVQALLDAGQVKVTMRNGKPHLSILRPLDERDPYQIASPGAPRKAQDRERLMLESR